MAQWFHRNALKATAAVKFDLKMIVADGQAVQLCSELRQARARLLDVMSDACNQTVSTLESLLNNYLALLHGFLVAVNGEGESKLRHAIRFRWTHTMLGNTPQAQQDAFFELVSMCHNASMWYTKHAAKIAAKDDITMDEAKEVHKCLRKAAGILSHLQDNYNGRLLDGVEQGSDVDPHVVRAYISQCTAEAQEVTIARAVEMKHNPALISALAHETAKTFTMAAEALATFDGHRFEKWQKYLQIKSIFYLAYAYCYAGDNLLGQNMCGEAIRALQESQKCYADASKLCKEYAAIKSRGTMPCRPEQNLFFTRLGQIVRRILEKCERENGFIYHQKVPPNPLPLELKATHGLASPEPFEMPSPNPLWTKATYAAFDLSRAFPNDPANSKAAAKAEGDLPPVDEAAVPQSANEPKTSSGCSVS